MRRRAPAPAAAPAAAQKKKRRVRDCRSLAFVQLERQKLRERLDEALERCKSSGRGGKAAVKSGLFLGVTRNMIDKRLGSGQRITLRDHHLQILTNDERKKLASWLLSCADGAKPKDRKDIIQ